MADLRCAVCLLLGYTSTASAITTINGTATCKTHVGHVANADILSFNYHQDKQ